MTLDFTEVNSHRARERGEGNEKSLVCSCTVPYAKVNRMKGPVLF